ncbi:hypothetical protein D3C73_1598610 [compost metagenome]
MLRGQGAQYFTGTTQVVKQLAGTGFVEFEGALQPLQDLGEIAIAQPKLLVNAGLQAGHGGRQLIAAPRCFAEPER